MESLEKILAKNIGISGYSVKVCYQEESILNALREVQSQTKKETLQAVLKSIESFKESQRKINSTEDETSYRDTEFNWMNDYLSQEDIKLIISNL